MFAKVIVRITGYNICPAAWNCQPGNFTLSKSILEGMFVHWHCNSLCCVSIDNSTIENRFIIPNSRQKYYYKEIVLSKYI